MFMQLFEDLRFIIGLYFAIVSLILLLVGMTAVPVQMQGFNLHLLASVYTGTFACLMLGLAFWSNRDLRKESL